MRFDAERCHLFDEHELGGYGDAIDRVERAGERRRSVDAEMNATGLRLVGNVR